MESLAPLFPIYRQHTVYDKFHISFMDKIYLSKYINNIHYYSQIKAKKINRYLENQGKKAPSINK